MILFNFNQQVNQLFDLFLHEFKELNQFTINSQIFSKEPFQIHPNHYVRNT